MAGVVFRYHTSRHHYLFSLTGGDHVKLVLRLPIETEFRQAEMRELGRAEFPYDVKRYYTLRVENDGPRIRCFIDGKLVIEASSDELPLGRAGVAANIPARFRNFRVSASDAAEAKIRERVKQRQVELNLLRAAQPQPKLWKRFKTPQFGAGRNVRIGDLDGDGQLDMLIAQNIPKVRGDAFDHISCLTAINFDGEVLWQIGRPDPRNGLLTNDTPFQIHDLDGDGRNEVVLVKDFKLQILEGATGKLKQSTWMPEAPISNRERPYELNNGDSIAFFNLSGKQGRREILIKDRYRGFWLFDNDSRLLWKGEGQTGHYPFPFDFDNDGRDEITIGFSVWDAAGKQRWSHDTAMQDHPDAISAGNYTGDPTKPPRAYFCSSDEGFLIVGADGKIVNHIRIGHVQTQSVGQFRPGTDSLEILVANFWKNPGIITMFDPDGNILAQDEMIPVSSHLSGVNWRGDGQEFALLSSNVLVGGMIDGQLRRVVMFPDDGHPDLAYAVRDVTGDERDEIIVWDQQEVWIYTQDPAGTDGEDGPTDAAGALCDAAVFAAMNERQSDPGDYLRRNDAYHFFAPLGALVITGPTHTNVCDLRVVVVDRIERVG
jgi:hypothetical protein